MTDLDTLRALAAELCEYQPDGTKAMDRRIARALGWLRVPPSEAGRKHGYWLRPDDVRNGRPAPGPKDLYRDVPDYTTSLDAALPGERVVHAELIRDGWQAEALDDECNVYDATAHTEPLARRAAALLAMAERMERDQ